MWSLIRMITQTHLTDKLTCPFRHRLFTAQRGTQHDVCTNIKPWQEKVSLGHVGNLFSQGPIIGALYGSIKFTTSMQSGYQPEYG
jgi:hypothetical protein